MSGWNPPEAMPAPATGPSPCASDRAIASV